MAYDSYSQLPPIECVVAVVAARKEGSFSAAAIALGTTHAAVSRRVAMAETWCGHSLFERRARGVQATAIGERVIGQLERLIEEMQHVGTGHLARSSLPVVRLTTTPSFARFWLMPRLAFLQGQPQDMNIAVIADQRLSDLRAGEADLAIRYGRGGWDAGVEHPIWPEVSVPVIADTASLTHGNPRALLDRPLLHCGDHRAWKTWAAAYGIAQKVKASDRLWPDYALALDAAVAGLGVALWNPSLHELPPGLIAFKELAVPAVLTYVLISRHGDVRSPAAKLSKRLRQCMAAH